MKSKKAGNTSKQILITGATGTLGQAFARLCEMRGISYRLLSRNEMDIADAASVRRALSENNSWAVINTAGYVRVDSAEKEPQACFRVNTEGAAILAAACAERKIQYLTFSSDLVFDGKITRAYVESDTASPVNIYGQSKAEAEQKVLAVNSDALIIRSAAFFSPWDDFNFLKIALRSLALNENFTAADDNFVSPTYVPDLVNASLDLLIDGEKGLWHLAQQGVVSWAEFARLAAEMLKLDSTLVIGCPAAELNMAAPRPAYTVLGSERGTLLPSLEHALTRFTDDYNARI